MRGGTTECTCIILKTFLGSTLLHLMIIYSKIQMKKTIFNLFPKNRNIMFFLFYK